MCGGRAHYCALGIRGRQFICSRPTEKKLLAPLSSAIPMKKLPCSECTNQTQQDGQSESLWLAIGLVVIGWLFFSVAIAGGVAGIGGGVVAIGIVPAIGTEVVAIGVVSCGHCC